VVTQTVGPYGGRTNKLLRWKISKSIGTMVRKIPRLLRKGRRYDGKKHSVGRRGHLLTTMRLRKKDVSCKTSSSIWRWGGAEAKTNAETTLASTSPTQRITKFRKED